MTLLQYLVKKNILDEKKAASLEYESKNSGKRIEELILARGLISEGLLYQLKSENLKIPLKEVIPEEVPLKVLELIPFESARYYKMVPLAKKDSVLEIGMVYPEDLNAQEALKFLARQGGFEYRLFLITPSSFNKLAKQYRSLKKEVKKALEELEIELKTKEIKGRPVEKTEFERMVEEAPVTKMVAVILRHAVEGKASDIHIEPSPKDLKVRFRLDGILHASLFLPMRIHPAVIARIKILADLKIDETRMPQDGRFSANIDGKRFDFRVSTFPTTLGEKVAIRVLDPAEGIKRLESLGLERRNYKVVKRAINKPYGSILATGPTGSGKTTTLYAILNVLNKEGVNIMTLEDPVEYFIDGVNQSQINPQIGYTFASGLRHMLRQDPDIIMVGEIRDEETADLATHAALTGHIVLSTLHTNNALGVIPRLIDLGVSPFLIPPTLNLALAQRLVRVLCPYCKEKISPSVKIKEMIKQELTEIKGVKLARSFSIYKAKGCRRCRSQGYAGRIAIFEALEMTDQLAEIISREPSEAKIQEEAVRQGMITMRQDGLLKALDGITSIEEVLRVTEA